jgi:protein TonB
MDVTWASDSVVAPSSKSTVPFLPTGRDARGRSGEPWIVPLAISCAIYGLGGAALVLLGGRHVATVAQKMVDVTFVERVLKPEVPPPPAAPQVELPPAAAAPVPAPHQQIRKLEKPPPLKKVVVPREMPKDAPAEADPHDDPGVAVFGDDAKPDPAGLEGGIARGGVVGGVVGGAIQLPDDAIPPHPKSSNAIPPYPQQARADGRTGVVALEIVVLADGSVDHVKVVRGDEPFASAAVAAVKTWRYEPARYKGQPISVYRTFQITFKLT